MMLKKKGLPEESELVICTVTSVQHHSVFVKINEYDISGMIHISEVSPGRIRNIRDFVKEGRIVVCKVLRVNKERGHVDLSLRRVTESQKRAKLNEQKQQAKAEKIVQILAEKEKKKPEEVYEVLWKDISKSHDTLFNCFMDIATGKSSLERLGVGKETSRELTAIIEQRMKPEEVQIKGVLKLRTYDAEGVEKIRAALKKAKEAGASLQYLGAGRYGLKVKADNYKKAEQIIKNASSAAIESIETDREASFEQT